MSTTLADPLFVRAEVAYRQERWGVAPGVPTGAWPDLGRRLHRWAASRRGSAPARPAPVHRPRHP